MEGKTLLSSDVIGNVTTDKFADRVWHLDLCDVTRIVSDKSDFRRY